MVAEASWRVRDPDSVLDELSAAPDLVATGESEGGEGLVFQWSASRDDLIARRRELPRGAICLESRPISITEDGDLELEDVTSLGTFTLRGGRLDFEGISETRLDAAVALVERRLGNLVSCPTRRVRSFDEYRSSTPSSPGPRRAIHEEPPVSEDRFRLLLWRRWIDDPVPRLGGISPRAAVASGRYRDELELVLRAIEHRSACERTNGLPGPEVAWLRAELGLDTEPLAV
jgi:hypothetical protein